MEPSLSSCPQLRDPGFRVGTLTLWNSTTNETSQPLDVYSNNEVYIGRALGSCQFQIQNPFVSNKHVRIYTILFDQDNPQDIPPLVYAQDLSLNGTLWNNYPMGKMNGSFLLSDGDVLGVAVGIHVRFQSSEITQENGFSYLQQLEMHEFNDSYVITQRLLGSGAYGRVHMAFKVDTGQQFACKVVDLQAIKATLQADMGGEQKSKFFAAKAAQAKAITTTRKNRLKENIVREKMTMHRRESLLLAELSHPNIITTQKVIQSSNTIYMFTELVTCGDLFSFLRYKGGQLEDTTAAMIIRQILLALEYLHDRDIVHRDVKPDNVLMTSLEIGGRVVLTDFGCARLVNQSVQRMTSVVGTLEYCAPELHPTNKNGYTKAVDMWSLGCVTAVLLIGNTPFDDPCRSTSKDLMNLESEMRKLEISSRPKDFIRRLLVRDETQRMDVKHALRHSWFTDPECKSRYEEIYKRSIQSWNPRSSSEPVIVDLASFKGPPASQRVPPEFASGWPPNECARFADVDHVSESSSENISPGEMRPLVSPVISRFAPTANASNHSSLVATDRTPPKEPKGFQKVRSQGTADDEVKFVSQVKREQLERHVLYVTSSGTASVPRSDENSLQVPHGGKQVPRDDSALVNETSRQNLFLSPRSSHLPSIRPAQAPATHQEIKDETDAYDEVYEEVCNLVTGKRKRCIYGPSGGSLSQML
ncbi:uncharacterized protein N7482_002626 [Penicillium canariense]|uniref:Uncharacterized protein n=1 Tax=Penicillium canariense TaxID=189055 RepID=A0A9W9LV08_9EURO|nr:uncharacterized protein N7482_002626 [Penicillium canariense]KAJ5176749.1 hypothetical protein N7482_002626 [Penicillium canariense]